MSAILATVACLSAVGHTAEPQAVLWSLRGENNTVYLLGSVHFLRPTDELPDAIEDAYADAEKLLMEIDMDDLDPLQMQQVTLELGMLPEGQTLEARLGSATYAKISEYARSIGLEPMLLNRFRPWLAAMTLVQFQLMKMGLDPRAGIEQRFVTRAVKDNKEILGLNTRPRQFAFFYQASKKHDPMAANQFENNHSGSF